MFLLFSRLRLVVVAVDLERAKAEVLAQAMTALWKKPRDEKVLVEADSAFKAVTANKRTAGTVEARVHLVLIKVLAEAGEVSVETTTVLVLHVVSVVVVEEAVGDLAKAAAAALGKGLKMTKNKMALKVEGLVPKVVVALEAAVVGLAAVVVVVAALVRVVAVVALVRVVVVLEVVVAFQVVMMEKTVVAEVAVLVVVAVVVDVASVVKMGTLQESALIRKAVVVVELVIPAVKRDTFQGTVLIRVREALLATYVKKRGILLAIVQKLLRSMKVSGFQ